MVDFSLKTKFIYLTPIVLAGGTSWNEYGNLVCKPVVLDKTIQVRTMLSVISDDGNLAYRYQVICYGSTKTLCAINKYIMSILTMEIYFFLAYMNLSLTDQWGIFKE